MQMKNSDKKEDKRENKIENNRKRCAVGIIREEQEGKGVTA